MKNCLTILIFSLFSTLASGQTELKTNPIALLFETVNLGVEQVVGDDWGVDGDLLAGGDLIYLTLALKYYFDSKYRADGFHVGIFTGFGVDLDTGAGIGFLAGYKLLSQKGILFEVGLGVGRGSDRDDILPYGKLQIGYRFNHNK